MIKFNEKDFHILKGSWGQENLNTARVRQEYYSYTETDYTQNPITQASVIEGPFYYDKENLVKEMAIRRVNKTIGGLLAICVIVAFVSYYFAMTNEVTLNKLSRQITTLNEENAELQNQLDRLKSFNNVDDKMMENNLLQKAAKVIEVPAVAPVAAIDKKNDTTAAFSWAIGY